MSEIYNLMARASQQAAPRVQPQEEQPALPENALLLNAGSLSSADRETMVEKTAH
jgi:hypothetical protein